MLVMTLGVFDYVTVSPSSISQYCIRPNIEIKRKYLLTFQISAKSISI